MVTFALILSLCTSAKCDNSATTMKTTQTTRIPTKGITTASFEYETKTSLSNKSGDVLKSTSSPKPEANNIILKETHVYEVKNRSKSNRSTQEEEPKLEKSIGTNKKRTESSVEQGSTDKNKTMNEMPSDYSTSTIVSLVVVVLVMVALVRLSNMIIACPSLSIKIYKMIQQAACWKRYQMRRKPYEDQEENPNYDTLDYEGSFYHHHLKHHDHHHSLSLSLILSPS